MSLASVSELGKDMLLHVKEHAFHQFGFMDVQLCPGSPLFEARRGCISIVALHVVSKQLTGFLFQSFVHIFSIFGTFLSLFFVFSYSFILLSDYLVSSVLRFLVISHLFEVSIFFPLF